MAEITKKKSLDELKKELSDIQAESDAKKQAVYDNELKLEKIEYNAPTDDEIYNLAKSYIDQKYTSLQSDEKKKVEDKKTSLSEEIKKAQKNHEDTQKRLDESYKSSQNEIEDQAIKRGIGRSSIVLNELTELENAKNAKKSESEKELSNSVNELSSQIDKLSEELNSSLKSLDMQKAYELSERIETLKNERDKKNLEVLKFNNQVEEKEKAFSKSLAKSTKEEIEDIEFSTTKQKLSAVMDYYLGFEDPKDALNEFEKDEDMHDLLGSYYTYVYNALKVR